MSLVIAKLDIAAPVQTVWDYVMDPGNMNDWVTISKSIGKVSDGAPREGYGMEQTLSLRGVHFKVKWKIAELDAPHFVRWEGRGPARSRAMTEYRLQENGAGTSFDYRNEFKTPLGPLGAAASKVLVGGISEREAEASLAQLKQKLES